MKNYSSLTNLQSAIAPIFIAKLIAGLKLSLFVLLATFGSTNTNLLAQSTPITPNYNNRECITIERDVSRIQISIDRTTDRVSIALNKKDTALVTANTRYQNKISLSQQKLSFSNARCDSIYDRRLDRLRCYYPRNRSYSSLDDDNSCNLDNQIAAAKYQFDSCKINANNSYLRKVDAAGKTLQRSLDLANRNYGVRVSTLQSQLQRFQERISYGNQRLQLCNQNLPAV